MLQTYTQMFMWRRAKRHCSWCRCAHRQQRRRIRGFLILGLLAVLGCALLCLLSVQSQSNASASTAFLKRHRTLMWWGANMTVYVSNLYPFSSGGPEALHQLHNTLNELGFHSVFVGQGRGYFEEFSNHFSIPGPINYNTVRPGADFLFRGEGDTENGPSLEPRFQRAGGRLGIYFLGQINDQPHLLHSQHHLGLCLNEYFRHVYGCVANGVANAPMAPVFSVAASLLGRNQTEKELLVLLDNDFDFDPDWLQVSHRSDVRFLILKGLSRADVISAYTRAKVIVDMYMPGAERDVYEASLFGTVAIVGRNGCARKHSCVPLAESYKIPFQDWETLNTKLEYILDHFGEAQKDMADVVEMTRTLDVEYRRNVFRYFHGNLHIITIADTQEELDAVIPFYLSALMLYPTISFEVFLPEEWLYFFKFENADVIRTLNLAGMMSGHSFQLRPLSRRYFGDCGRALLLDPELSTRHQRSFTFLVSSPSVMLLSQSLVVSHASIIMRGDTAGIVYAEANANIYMLFGLTSRLVGSLPTLRCSDPSETFTQMTWKRFVAQDSAMWLKRTAFPEGVLSLDGQNAALSYTTLYHFERITESRAWRDAQYFMSPRVGAFTAALRQQVAAVSRIPKGLVPADDPYSLRYQGFAPSVDTALHQSVSSGETFMLFRVCFGFTNQLRSFLNGVAYSVVLGKTMVLPDFFPHYNYFDDETGAVHSPMSDFFALDPIRQAVSAHAKIIDRLPKALQQVAESVREGPAFSPTSAAFLNEFQSKWSKQLVTRFSCLLCSVAWDTSKLAELRLRMLRSLLPGNRVRPLYERVLHKLGGRNVLALHLRIESDFYEYCRSEEKRSAISWVERWQHCYLNAKKVAQYVKLVIETQSLAVDSLYVASGRALSREDKEALSSVTGLETVTKEELGVVIDEREVGAAVDFFLCLGAQVFVGNMFSSMSFIVREVRAATGVPDSFYYNFENLSAVDRLTDLERARWYCHPQ